MGIGHVSFEMRGDGGREVTASAVEPIAAVIVSLVTMRFHHQLRFRAEGTSSPVYRHATDLRDR